MAKPVTAIQIAAIIWVPIIIGGLIWLGVSEDKAANQRNAETQNAVTETELAGRSLRRKLQKLDQDMGNQP